MKMSELVNKWSKHCGMNIYHANADLSAISTAIGFDNMVDYVNLKLSGDETTSLNDFAKSRGYVMVQWSELL